MSSRHHTPGISQSPRDIGKRNLRGVLANHQQKTADIRDVLYIKPLGGLQHLVQNIGTNTQAYRVGSNLPGITFKPGEVVQVASNTGHPGENIISVAPPGKKGSVPGFLGKGSVTLPTPTLTNESTAVSGSFIGFYGNGSTLEAWEYDDSGTYVQTLATASTSYASAWSSVVPIQWIVHRYNDSGVNVPILLGRLSLGPPTTFFVWDIGNGVYTEHSISAPAWRASLWQPFVPMVKPSGTDGYAYMLIGARNGAGTRKGDLYRAKIDGTGAVETVASEFDFNWGVIQGPPCTDGFVVGGLVVTWAGSSFSHGGNIAGRNLGYLIANYPAAANHEHFTAIGTGSPLDIDHFAYDSQLQEYDHESADVTVTTPPYGGSDVQVTINRTGDTGGYFWWDKSASLREMKLYQPGQGTGATGNSTSAPIVSFGANGGNYPDWVHLWDYSHTF